MLIAIPVHRVSCNVVIDKVRAWSVVDEFVLWGITRQSKSIRALATESGLPRQLIVASIARLMRFRLVEVLLLPNEAAFQASEYGIRCITSGKTLPTFPKKRLKSVSFVIAHVTGEFFLSRDVRLMSPYKIEIEEKNGTEVRKVIVQQGGPAMSHESNFARLCQLAARGADEEVATIDYRSASLRSDEHMIARVADGAVHGLPEAASETLRATVLRTASLPDPARALYVDYAGPSEESTREESVVRSCSFSDRDLIIGSEAQRSCFLEWIQKAHQRLIIHSTFISADGFEGLLDPIRVACRRGVVVDLVWGGDADEGTEARNTEAAVEIMKQVRGDRDLAGRFIVHLRPTGSHAKLMLLDTAEGDWLGVLSTCNWFKSPFRAIEMSVLLRDWTLVADLAVALQRIVGRRGLADRIATEMAGVVRSLRSLPPQGGTARVALLAGDEHDRLMRVASAQAEHRFVVGTNKLGSTARPGALIQSEVAAQRPGIDPVVLYSRVSGPLRKRDAQDLADEAESNGVRLLRSSKPLHAKFLAWDDNDLLVTSLNWGSAASNLEFPWTEMGLHIRAPGIAASAIRRLQEVLPELNDDPRSRPNIGFHPRR